MIRKLSLAFAISALVVGLVVPSIGWAQYAPSPYYPHYYYYYPYHYPNAYNAPRPQTPGPAAAPAPNSIQPLRRAPSSTFLKRWKQYQQNAEFRNQIRSPNNPETDLEFMLRSFW